MTKEEAIEWLKNDDQCWPGTILAIKENDFEWLKMQAWRDEKEYNIVVRNYLRQHKLSLVASLP